ncbi:MAG: hypothetical protein EOP04_28200 [Proteobacteria bacterium]|nr:MAG: hypothetical protein EOP04_28200 [Pseudomonadota bacterium]
MSYEGQITLSESNPVVPNNVVELTDVGGKMIRVSLNLAKHSDQAVRVFALYQKTLQSVGSIAQVIAEEVENNASANTLWKVGQSEVNLTIFASRTVKIDLNQDIFDLSQSELSVRCRR